MKKALAVLLALVFALSTASFAADTSFSDVAADAYYADAVAWAVEKTVTDGMGDGTFAPATTVNRAQAVTFLWRMAGRPEPTKTETFADVEADANNWWYKTAVQWAVENEITNGTGEGFSPYVTCSRGMILTMLYRLEGKPWDAAMTAVLPENEEDYTLEDFGNALVQAIVNGIRTENALPDVAEGEYYELPVIWAIINSILDENQMDMETMAVMPGAHCPRGEMVYFLYHASGDAPVPVIPGSVETGTIPKTVVLDKGGVKITLNGIETDDYGTPRLALTIVNGSDKLLRADTDEFFVNSYVIWPQVYIPEENEDGWIFYSDAIAAPGETKDFYVSLGSLGNMNITAVYELEFNMVVKEVEKNEDDYYDYVDDYASGEVMNLKTSLYNGTASYDMEGTPVIDTDGLKVLIVKAENDEFSGPQLTVYAYNSGSEDLALEITGLKLDGESYETFFSMTIPAGRRSVGDAYITYDYENTPTVKEAEITFRKLNPETWEPIETFESVTVAFAG